MGSDHQQHIISFGPMSCLRPFSRGAVRKCEDGGGHFYQRKLSLRELDEPTSPKVGCTGQIKRNKVGPGGNKDMHKFFKLKKMFSGKNLSRGGSEKFDQRDCDVVRIVELDPPLPVPKPAVKDCTVDSLWNRRCGHPLESLQLQPQRSPQLQQLRLQLPQSQLQKKQ